MYSILCHWVCILMFKGHLVECVGWWEFVCELSETLNSMYSFCRIFWEWDEWPSLRRSRSLSFPSLRSLLMWLHSMFDLSWSLSSSSHPLFFLMLTHFGFGTLFASSLHISLSIWFSSLPRYCYHIHIGHPWVHGSRYFLYMLHFIHEGMGFDHWVFGPIFPSFLSSYYPSLRYVPCLKTTLRP